MEFSHRTRQRNLEQMPRHTFDIIVIGGGITGAGVARDAALRGYSVALLEKGDFASGTSSKSARFVHGGFRYLQQLQLGLVMSACAERKRLLELAPRLVRPADFVFPVFQRDRHSLAQLNLGMWFYECLALFRTPARHRLLTPEEVRAREPAVLQQGLEGAVRYHDCLADDARLTLATLKAAHARGALLANYVEVSGLYKQHSRVAGVYARDVLTGESFLARTHAVANAAGPWVDNIRRMDDPHAPKFLRANRGSHVCLPKERLPLENVVIFSGAGGGRFMYAVPWGKTVIVGTTDLDHHDDLDEVYATAAEVESILTSLNRVFPGARLTPADVLSTYAGLRPLLARGEGPAYQASRDHRIFESPSGLVSIAGGKLTTYRLMAADMVDYLARRLAEGGRSPGRKAGNTATTPIVALSSEASLAIAGLQEAYPYHGSQVLSHLANTYGPAARDVLAMAEEDGSLAQRLHPERPYLYAEIPFAVQYEMAMTLSDFFIRRTHLIHETEDQGLGAAPAAAAIMARYLDWDAAEVQRQVEAYRREVRLSNLFRSPDHSLPV